MKKSLNFIDKLTKKNAFEIFLMLLFSSLLLSLSSAILKAVDFSIDVNFHHNHHQVGLVVVSDDLIPLAVHATIPYALVTIW